MRYLIIGQANNSEAEKLKEYLIRKNENFYLISFQSFLNFKNQIFFEKFLNGQKHTSSYKYFLVKNNYILFTLFNFISLYFSLFYIIVFKEKARSEITIGVSLFSSFLAYALKKLSITKNFIYYSLDFYQNKTRDIFLKFYLFLFVKIDVVLYKNSIKTWNSSIRIDKLRKNQKLHLNKSLVVTNGFFKDYFSLEKYKYDSKNIVFVGTLSENQSIDVLLNLMPKIHEKFGIKLDIIGDGPFKNNLKTITKKLKIEEKVIFHGFIESEKKMCEIISRAVLCYCVYKGNFNDNSLIASPGKLALYNAVGIPSIISSHTFLSKYHKRFNSGLITSSDPEDIFKKISYFMSDKNLRIKIQKNLESIRPIWFTERRYKKAFNSIKNY